MVTWAAFSGKACSTLRIRLTIITAPHNSDRTAEILLRGATLDLAVNKLVDQVGESPEILHLMNNVVTNDCIDQSQKAMISSLPLALAGLVPLGKCTGSDMTSCLVTSFHLTSKLNGNLSSHPSLQSSASTPQLVDLGSSYWHIITIFREMIKGS